MWTSDRVQLLETFDSLFPRSELTQPEIEVLLESLENHETDDAIGGMRLTRAQSRYPTPTIADIIKNTENIRTIRLQKSRHVSPVMDLRRAGNHGPDVSDVEVVRQHFLAEAFAAGRRVGWLPMDMVQTMRMRMREVAVKAGTLNPPGTEDSIEAEMNEAAEDGAKLRERSLSDLIRERKVAESAKVNPNPPPQTPPPASPAPQNVLVSEGSQRVSQRE